MDYEGAKRYLTGLLAQVPQNAQGLLNDARTIPQQLAGLLSPQMNQQVQAAYAKPQPANPQQWMDAGMNLAGMAPVGGLVGMTNGAGLLGNVGTPANIQKMEDLASISQKWKQNGVTVDAMESRNAPVITLSKLVVPSEARGQGIGTQAVKDVLGYADETGKTVALSPSTDFGGSSVARLKEFYKRLGFVENKGKNKDFTISESMYYSPKK